MAAADSTFQSLLQAVLDGTTTAIDVSTTTTTTLLAGKAGFRACVLAARLRSSGANNLVKFAYGSSPTGITGDEELDDGAVYSLSSRDYQIIAAPEGEALKSVITRSAGQIGGFITCGYIKVRG
tara:strand:+ start:270 stop:641 length:372 start_codon:yes stop_codon:yes gene_type:complete